MKISNLAKKAKNFTINAHDSINHKRKYTDEPYWVHPERVAKIVASITDDEEIISAAWLHDVLEDVAPTNPNYNQAAIQREFGDRVLRLVLEVTNVSKLSDGNRAARKAIDHEHLKQASDDGKLIKLADLIDNVIDISKNDPGFFKIFKKEIEVDLPYLPSGSKQLYQQLRRLLS